MERRIERYPLGPTQDEKETKGVLAPIAARVLMKILFCRKDGQIWFASCRPRTCRQSHKMVWWLWQGSVSTDPKLEASDCWCRSCQEYDNRSTSGCILVLVGPNHSSETSVQLAISNLANMAPKAYALPKRALVPGAKATPAGTPSVSIIIATNFGVSFCKADIFWCTTSHKWVGFLYAKNLTVVYEVF